MLSFREVVTALVDLQIPADSPVIVHADMDQFGEIRGGAETILSALYTIAKRIIFPAFTPTTMVIPLDGPENNGITYGTCNEENLSAVKFHPELPVDASLGQLAEKFRLLPQTSRSSHPIISFSAINFEIALQSQTIQDPLAPISHLAQGKGRVLLMGVDQTKNTTLHYIEKLAGRRQYTRWARVGDSIVECPNMPGCPCGFIQANPYLQPISRSTLLNEVMITAIPINLMIHRIRSLIQENPLALLCDSPDCEQCQSIRNDR